MPFDTDRSHRAGFLLPLEKERVNMRTRRKLVAGAAIAALALVGMACEIDDEFLEDGDPLDEPLEEPVEEPAD